MSPPCPSKCTLMQQHLSIPPETGAGQGFRSTALLSGGSSGTCRATSLSMRCLGRAEALPCTGHTCPAARGAPSCCLLTLRWFISPGIPQWAAGAWDSSSPSLPSNPSEHLDVSVFFLSTLTAHKLFFLLLFLLFGSGIPAVQSPAVRLCPSSVVCACLWPPVGIHGELFLNSQVQAGVFWQEGIFR